MSYVISVLTAKVNTPFQEGYATARAISPKEAAGEALRQLNSGKDEIYVKMSKMIYWISRLAPKYGVNMVNGFISAEVEEILKKR